MYTENPLVLNPALCGANQVLRASVSYMDQWRQLGNPFKTFGMSMDMKFKPDNWQQVDAHRGMTFKERTMSRLAGGMSIYSDKAGISRLSTLNTALSVAYFVPLTGEQFLSFGLQAGLCQQQIENESLLFPGQFNGITYDKSLSSGESFDTFYRILPDYAAGFLWALHEHHKRVGEYGIKRMNVGLSIFHLRKSAPGFFKQTHPGAYRFQLHGELVYLAPRANVGLSPSAYLSLQGTTFFFSAGSFVSYYFNENSKYTGYNKRSSLALGAFYRQGNVLSFQMIYEKSEQYAIGMCYALTLSDINVVSRGRTGFEILLRYTPPMAFLYEKKQSN
jgi:type IX secretion system PorP/SprF family membrane protein